jgi:single-strand DNA-binding protein
MSFNKIIFIGRLTADPEIKWTQTGSQIANFSIAVDRQKTKDKEKETDFFNIVAWGKLAEICAQYIKKGKLVLVEGSGQNQSYEKDGVRRIFFKVIAKNIQMLDNKKDSQNNNENEIENNITEIKKETNTDPVIIKKEAIVEDYEEFDPDEMPF